MKIEGLVANVAAVGSPDRADRAIFGGDSGWVIFLPIQAVFVVGELLCDVETPS